MHQLLKSRALLSRAQVLLRKATGRVRRAKSHRTQFYREMWVDSAARIGAAINEISGDLLQVTRNGVSANVMRNYTDLDGSLTLRAAGNKRHVHDVLRENGIPTPAHLPFKLSSIGDAKDFLQAHTMCVVKPNAGTGAGDGVTTRVTTPRQLTRAAVFAAGFCSDLLIEKQVPGDNLRLLYLDGHLLDAVHRRAPAVRGDGKSTVSQLVQKENHQRLEGGFQAAQVILKHDLDMKQTLAAQGLSWNAVPDRDQHVVLKTVINDNAAAENVCVVSELCESIVDVGREAAKAIGVRLAGVDVVTTDTSVPLAESDGIILEINTAPGLYIHCCGGDQRHEIVDTILEACLEHSRRNAELCSGTITTSP